MGIAEKDQFHIFERYYKAALARERSKIGSGLGLSIVKRIIDFHHSASYFVKGFVNSKFILNPW
ncbi:MULTISPECIES: ATP-binding protein [Bacillaceae]|uniref:ATP-binding protein n=1 Tax=Bacillaceae TaxID=186817 RepID=UPI00296E42F1|nr:MULTISPECIES: ATP-binding protein [Peribacillus]MEA3575845.1 hypothetical protein [Peribacillus frigoritolerans]